MAAPQTLPAGTEVQFVNLTPEFTAVDSKFLWDFGDGNSSTEEDTTHVYTDPGTYTVSLTLMDVYGSYVGTKDSYIQVLRPPAGVVEFVSAPQNGSPGTEVNFVNLTAGFVAEDCKFLWDFGDGNSSTEENPAHTYNHCGTFDVSLTLGDAYGYYTTTEENYITISPSGFEFAWAPQIGVVDGEVHFINLTPGNFEKFLWDFGDGNSSAKEDPSHIYTVEGTYSVRLTLMDPDGYYYTRGKSITIIP